MRHAAIGFDGQREPAESVLNAGVGQSLVLLDEPRRADHISVENDGELSRRVLCHEKALFFEFGASAPRYYRGSAGVASEGLRLATNKCRCRNWHAALLP